MYVKKLKIENFRGIRNMELELHPRLNVFIGVNGAGKSSVLDALAYLLAIPVQVFCGQPEDIYGVTSNNKNDYPDSEIHNDEAESKLAWTITKENMEELTWDLASFRTQQRTFDKSPTRSMYLIVNRGVWHSYFVSGDNVNPIFHLIVYYRVQRAVDNVSIEAWANRNFQKQDAFVDALAPKIDFKEFFEWFRNREDLENEDRAEGKNTPDRFLQPVRNVISAFLDTVSEVRIRRRDPLRMVVTKNDRELRIEQLSDGEKCLLALVGDLARRMAIANPSLENPLHGEGVVLIDEIDLHLHPQWQRMVLPKLMEIFPNTQFIVTTHSPQVLGEIKNGKGKIISLRDGDNGIEAMPGEFNIFGQTSDVILADVMRASERNDDISKAIKAIFDAIKVGQLDEARRLKNELEAVAHGIPEFAQIELLLLRKEKLGK